MATEPDHRTLSETLLWSLRITKPVVEAPITVKIWYEVNSKVSSTFCSASKTKLSREAEIISGLITLLRSTPLTTRYEPPKAPPRKVTIPNAYPSSSLFAATAIIAPTIPSEMETPQRPGLPSPTVSKPFENQFSLRANLAAIVAFNPVTTIRRRNRSSGESRGSTLKCPISKPEVTACMPIQRLDAAIPRDARFPESLFNARPWSRIVDSRIMPATPSSPSTDPAVEPIARRTKVDCAAIAS